MIREFSTFFQQSRRLAFAFCMRTCKTRARQTGNRIDQHTTTDTTYKTTDSVRNDSYRIAECYRSEGIRTKPTTNVMQMYMARQSNRVLWAHHYHHRRARAHAKLQIHDSLLSSMRTLCARAPSTIMVRQRLAHTSFVVIAYLLGAGSNNGSVTLTHNDTAPLSNTANCSAADSTPLTSNSAQRSRER